MLREEREHILYIVHEKYSRLFKHVNELSIKQKRNVFRQLRQHAPVTANSFLPQLGITAGQFAVLQRDNCCKVGSQGSP